MQAFAAGGVNDLGIRRRHSDRANGLSVLAIEDWTPCAAVINRLPDASINGAYVEDVRLGRDAGGRSRTASAEGANHAPVHVLIELFGDLRVGRGAEARDQRACQEEFRSSQHECSDTVAHHRSKVTGCATRHLRPQPGKCFCAQYAASERLKIGATCALWTRVTPNHEPGTEYLPKMGAIAREAGALLMQFFDRNIKIEYKGDADLVTAADRKSEALIRERIRETWPGHDVLGEEEGLRDTGSEFRWYVDP